MRVPENNYKNIFNLVGAILLVVLLIFLDHITALKPAKKVSLAKFASSVSAHTLANVPLKVTITPSPTASPSPTLTPEPAPVYTGYCLDVPVLYYHHTAPEDIARQRGFSSLNVDAGIFDQQMAYLSTHGFTSIFGSDLASALKNHTALPPKSIVVTLDDGYDDVYSYAFQSAKKYGIKFTLFIPTGLIGGNTPTNSYYTWGQLQEMVNSGLAEADNHTWSHYALGTQGPDKDNYEMKTAEDQLQQYLGKHSSVFAYPYGTNAMSAKVDAELAQFGFTGAYSTIGGTYQCDSFIYSLHRTRIGNISFPAFGIY